jgi:hypothetical protein
MPQANNAFIKTEEINEAKFANKNKTIKRDCKTREDFWLVRFLGVLLEVGYFLYVGVKSKPISCGQNKAHPSCRRS